MYDYKQITLATMKQDKQTQDECENLIGMCFKPEMIKGEDGVLIFGLNPAGGKTEAKNEREDVHFFLNRVDGIKKEFKRTNSTYFSPIYDFVEGVIDAQPKWNWCNFTRDYVEERIRNDNAGYEEKQIRTILKHYDKHADSRCTIYIGDLFYVHKTKSSEFAKFVDDELRIKNCGNILKMHIQHLLEGGVNLKFVYVNNGKASDWLCESLGLNNPTKTIVSVEHDGKTVNIPVFFGAMLSSGVTDKYSRQRLQKEIKDTIE